MYTVKYKLNEFLGDLFCFCCECLLMMVLTGNLLHISLRPPPVLLRAPQPGASPLSLKQARICPAQDLLLRVLSHLLASRTPATSGVSLNLAFLCQLLPNPYYSIWFQRLSPEPPSLLTPRSFPRLCDALFWLQIPSVCLAQICC